MHPSFRPVRRSRACHVPATLLAALAVLLFIGGVHHALHHRGLTAAVFAGLAVLVVILAQLVMRGEP